MFLESPFLLCSSKVCPENLKWEEKKRTLQNTLWDDRFSARRLLRSFWRTPIIFRLQFWGRKSPILWAPDIFWFFLLENLWRGDFFLTEAPPQPNKIYEVDVLLTTIRAQIHTCSFVFRGEFFLEMLALAVTALNRYGVPSQEAMQLPLLISGELAIQAGIIT